MIKLNFTSFADATNSVRIAPHVQSIIMMLSTHAEQSAEERASIVHDEPLSSLDAADTSLCSALGSLPGQYLSLAFATWHPKFEDLGLAPMFCENIAAIIRIFLLSPALVTLLASSGPPRVWNTSAVRSIILLAKRTKCVSISILAQRHLDALMRSMPKVPPCYKKGSATWLLVDGLVRSCPDAALLALNSSLGEILVTHVKPSCSPQLDVRISGLR